MDKAHIDTKTETTTKAVGLITYNKGKELNISRMGPTTRGAGTKTKGMEKGY